MKYRFFKYYTLKSLAKKNIFIDESSKIDRDAKVETRYGGNITIGKKTHIRDSALILSYGGDIIIGDFCDINAFTVIYGHGGVTIGNHVLIAGHCMIIPNNHIYQDINIPIAKQGNESIGIIIEDDVWIGHGCSILDGISIGKGSVIAAGSVVKSNVESYSVVGGIPAKLLKKRE